MTFGFRPPRRSTSGPRVATSSAAVIDPGARLLRVHRLDVPKNQVPIHAGRPAGSRSPASGATRPEEELLRPLPVWACSHRWYDKARSDGQRKRTLKSDIALTSEYRPPFGIRKSPAATLRASPAALNRRVAPIDQMVAAGDE
jgi:hypothetical protein